MRTTLRPILVTNTSANYSNQHMLMGLHRGFQALGYNSQLHLIEQDGAGLENFLATLPPPDSREAGNTFIVDLNARMRLPQTETFKKFSFITDHPFALLEQILACPPNNVLGYVDRSHRAFLDALQLPQRRLFFPHGGPPPEPNRMPIKERKIDAFFVGRLDHSPRLKDLKEGLKKSPDPIPRIIQETAERALTGTPLFEALILASRDAQVELKDIGLPGIQNCLSIASNWAEARRRHDILTNLDGVKITLAGSIRHDFFDKTPPNIEFLGPIPFVEAQSRIRQAKLLLNIVGVFPDGSHERIWYGMANGCAVLTDRGKLINEDFTDGENIFCWPEDHKKMSAFLGDLLETPSKLENAVNSAISIYRVKHTWTQRAETILTAMGKTGE